MNYLKILPSLDGVVYHLLLIILLINTSTVLFAKTVETDNFTNVTYLYNYDGDTINFHLNDNLPLLFQNMSVRLYGIDTPELHSKDKCESELSHKIQIYVEDKLKNSKNINLINCEKGKYFRLVCSIEIDNQDLTKDLLSHHYGVPYYGDTKEKVNWCVDYK